MGITRLDQVGEVLAAEMHRRGIRREGCAVKQRGAHLVTQGQCTDHRPVGVQLRSQRSTSM